ncbi:MAG: hypothetical protein KME23_19130 [Goleter apudmare HA4340-LM2]|nr:hypothetical protein [Goleter apudmare HA4340-LM2]
MLGVDFIDRVLPPLFPPQNGFVNVANRQLVFPRLPFAAWEVEAVAAITSLYTVDDSGTQA